MATIKKIETKFMPTIAKKRVAAYARVSSDKDAMLLSLSSQISYYNNYISMHRDWDLVEIYSDEGISGTKENRPGFQKMLYDCRNGKIDLVLAKSITRFARNTVILLETVRELKTLGIDVYFEKENIHTLSSDGEFMITLLASYSTDNMKKLKASDVTSWLEQQGYLSEIEYYDGCYCRELTKKSQEIGLTLIKKQNQYGNEYNVILYDRNAQEYIINHLSDISEFVIKK